MFENFCLAILELNYEDKREKKIVILSKKFSEAKKIKNHLDKKYSLILNILEKNIGNEARLRFKDQMEEKIKLTITAKEVEDKIQIL